MIILNTQQITRWTFKLLIDCIECLKKNNLAVSLYSNSTFRNLYWNNQTYEDIMQIYLLCSYLLLLKEVNSLHVKNRKKRMKEEKKYLPMECYTGTRIIFK